MAKRVLSSSSDSPHVTGLILGLIALNQIKTTGERGRGLAITALIVGCAYMAIFAYIIFGVLSAEGRSG